MIIGFEFTTNAAPYVTSVEAARVWMGQMLHPNASIAVHNIELEYLGQFGQSSPVPLGTVITGKVWLEVPEQ